MSDIVDRLRDFADLFEVQHAPGNLVLHMRAAADEIERLRAGGCARDQGTTQYCAEAAKKDAEIASLLNVLADTRTENMRLRAALIVWQNAYKTGRNEPLVQAYEHSTSLIAALNGEEGRT